MEKSDSTQVPLIVMLAGHAGVGKSTLATALARGLAEAGRPACLVDKDVFAPMVEALNLRLGLENGDRHSTAYTQTVRPLEYEAMFNLVWSNAASGVGTVVVAPLVAELGASDWLDLFRQRAAGQGARVVIVWVECSPSITRARLRTRGLARDGHKLQNWGDYVSDLADWRSRADAIVNNDGASYELVTWCKRQPWL